MRIYCRCQAKVLLKIETLLSPQKKTHPHLSPLIGLKGLKGQEGLEGIKE